MGGNAQFLLQLPHQGGLGCFARLDLAAGKLPQARHRFPSRALLQEDPTVGVDQGNGNDMEQEMGRDGRVWLHKYLLTLVCL